MSEIEIIPLKRNRCGINRFLGVSYGIYRSDPNWVAPMLLDLKKVLRDDNPLFDHVEMVLWVARRDGMDIGRIAGILDRHHMQKHGDDAVFFGFFECVDDIEVSHKLFDTMFVWARQQGARRVFGPMNPTMNDECGMLVKGFDTPPVFMMTYNPPYYLDLVEAAGFRKAKDLLAYHMDFQRGPFDRITRIADKTRQLHPELNFRPIQRANFRHDLTKVIEVYNAAWESNWGFVPISNAMIDFMANRLKPLFVEELIWIAESPDGPVGCMMILPDYNFAIKPLRGRLLTPRIFGFLPYLLHRKCMPRCRVVMLGVKSNYRNCGLEAVMLSEGFKTGLRIGFKDVECSWILEENLIARRLLEIFGGRPYKSYRLYEREF
jgi:hypothetical protein